jgi:hypothetical protein
LQKAKITMNKKTLFMLIAIFDIAAIGVFAFAIFRQNGDGGIFSSPLAIAALVLFAAGPILAVILSRLSPASTDGLLQTGLPANATVLEVWDIRWGTKNGMAQVGLKLRINPPSDSSYETKTTAAVSPLNPAPYREGMVVRVRYNPSNPKQVVIDDGSSVAAPAPAAISTTVNTGVKTSVHIQFPQGNLTPEQQQLIQNAAANQQAIQITSQSIENLSPALQKLIQSALVDADHNGIPDIMERRDAQGNLQVINLSSASLQDRIEKLDKLRDSGLITQEQLDMIRNRMEKKNP